MSCPSATSPINIIKMKSDKCDLKCEFQHSYKITTLSATNKGDYINYVLGQSNEPPVTFNGDQYNVNSMRIYQPSLHTFNSKHTSAEIVIEHSNVTQNQQLLVCIPVTSGASSAGVGDSIINQVASKAPSLDTATNITQPSFSLNNLIPLKPYYYYKGTLPYSPCNNSVEYVVFDSENAIKLQNSCIMNLQKIITPNTYTTHENSSGYYYNKNGATKHLSGDGEIYIECNPTGSEGETVVAVDSSDSADISKTLGSFFTSPWSQGILGAILGVLIIYGIYKFARQGQAGGGKKTLEKLANLHI